VEHNVLEGLPISQYKEVEITVGPSAVESKRVELNDWKPMPRDSHLLPEHSQQILRAARLGKIYKPPAPPEDDKDVEEEDEHKEVSRGFTVKKWVRVPRHLEDSEPEYLAKRRKGLPSQYVANGQVSVQPAAVRETKVKKTDAEGNVSVYKVLVPEGQAVEGEIQATDAVIEAAPIVAAPGTVVEGVGVVNAEGVVVANDILQHTPPRRRPPPPKKKRKSGPGRGKKKVIFVEGASGQGTPASGAESGLLAPPGFKQEEGSVEPSEGGDTPMPDAGDEDEGSGEEGSDDEDREEGTHSPTPARSVLASETPSAAPVSASATESTEISKVEEAPLVEVAAIPDPPASTPVEPQALPPIDTAAPIPPQPETEARETIEHDPSSSPDLPLSAMAHSRQNSLNQIPTLPTIEPQSTVTEVKPELEARSELEPVQTNDSPISEPVLVQTKEATLVVEPVPAPVPEQPPASQGTPIVDASASDGEPDLLGSLERQLDKDSESLGAF
jgi:hypothetical protein